MQLKFKTKSDNLANLFEKIQHAIVLPQIQTTVKDWVKNPELILEEINSKGWQDKPLIVRSSCMNEDSSETSCAGVYKSVINIKGKEKIVSGIKEVIDSFSGNNELDQVFIQPMLENVVLSGVAFSTDPNTGAPYIIINYDKKTGSTSSVTSGNYSDVETFYYYKKSKHMVDSNLKKIIELINELENIFCSDSIDIEFAINADNKLYLLQVRPLLINKDFDALKNDKKSLTHSLINISDKIQSGNQPHPYLHGYRTVYGVMPDWNPAEIIGVRPRPLSLSLYKEIITDNIWAYQRDNYGYRKLRSFPLLISFYGLPYIDVRVSFNSFIPADVDDSLAEKLVNYYIDKLIETPSNHDKVEFEIIFSCYTFDLPERLGVLKENGFNDEESAQLTTCLRDLTNKICHRETGLWKIDIDKIGLLEKKRENILASDLDNISKLYWLLEDCKRYGTLPFAGLARAGFIAIQLLKSLVHVEILSQDDYEKFISSLDTVSSKMQVDFVNQSRDEFLKNYGHLRPGTYDILSPRYDEEPERYFNWKKIDNNVNTNKSQFSLSLKQLNAIESLLVKHKMDPDVLGLFDFIRSAIEGREYAKFIFTRSVSDVLNLFRDLGSQYGISLNDCSYADINCIKEMYSSSTDIEQLLNQSVQQGKRNHELSQLINLPPLITSHEDVWGFHLPANEPNFVTLKRVIGEPQTNFEKLNDFKEKILFIDSADPGFDWIFSHGISGFITKFGGINSHMAIRAGELGIPAVIGAGSNLFEKWRNSKLLEIDCSNKQVKILK